MKPTKAEESKARMVKLCQRLYAGHGVTTRFVRQTFGVSKATAKRDLKTLREYLPTYGDKELRLAA